MTASVWDVFTYLESKHTVCVCAHAGQEELLSRDVPCRCHETDQSGGCCGWRGGWLFPRVPQHAGAVALSAGTFLSITQTRTLVLVLTAVFWSYICVNTADPPVGFILQSEVEQSNRERRWTHHVGSARRANDPCHRHAQISLQTETVSSSSIDSADEGFKVCDDVRGMV